MKRDQSLTEAMGECWHDYSQDKEGEWYGDPRCSKCRQLRSDIPLPDFSTWRGFGKLWEWAQNQEWWSDFCTAQGCTGYIPGNLIHPDRFATAVYSFLKGLKL
jgi:hypothetical protein